MDYIKILHKHNKILLTLYVLFRYNRIKDHGEKGNK